MLTSGILLHDVESERSFCASIDAQFPYADPIASKLILQGWQISLNAAFCVLEELCRPPLSVDVSKGRLRELLAEWMDGPDHNLKTPVLSAAHCLIDGKKPPWRESIQLMLHIGDYDGQRAALAIA